MPKSIKPPVKSEVVVVRIDADFADALDRLALRKFEGERSRLVRQAIRELIEAEESTNEEVVAA